MGNKPAKPVEPTEDLLADYTLPFILYIASKTADVQPHVDNLLLVCKSANFWKEYIQDILSSAIYMKVYQSHIPIRVHSIRVSMYEEHGIYMGTLRWTSRAIELNYLQEAIQEHNTTNYPTELRNTPLTFHVVPASKGLTIHTNK